MIPGDAKAVNDDYRMGGSKHELQVMGFSLLLNGTGLKWYACKLWTEM